jgi:hypothetical protein
VPNAGGLLQPLLKLFLLGMLAIDVSRLPELCSVRWVNCVYSPADSVLPIEARQAAVESVASAADAAVHISGEMIGRNRWPIANLRRLS